MSNVERLEEALQHTPPFDAAYAVAITLRDAGVPQAELLQLFDEARERHANDDDETRYDAILEVMDFIGGGCQPSKAIYPNGPESP
jgi:hypothetical protein